MGVSRRALGCILAASALLLAACDDPPAGPGEQPSDASGDADSSSDAAAPDANAGDTGANEDAPPADAFEDGDGDAGADASADSGSDGGTDAGPDAAPETGTDGNVPPGDGGPTCGTTWAKVWHTSPNVVPYDAAEIEIDGAGNIYVIATIGDYGTDPYDSIFPRVVTLVQKLDGLGNVLWEKRLEGDIVGDTTVTPSGELFLVHMDTTTGTGGPRLRKLDASGHDLWRMEVHGSDKVAARADGTAIVASLDAGENQNWGGPHYYSGLGALLVAKIGLAGQVVWSNAITYDQNAFLKSLAVSPTGEVAVLIESQRNIPFGAHGSPSGVVLARLDAGGEVQWVKGIEPYLQSDARVAFLDADTVVVATRASLVLLDAAGAEVFRQPFTGGSIEPRDLAVTDAAISIAGDMNGAVDFGGGPVTSNAAVARVRFDHGGGFLAAQVIDGPVSSRWSSAVPVLTSMAANARGDMATIGLLDTVAQFPEGRVASHLASYFVTRHDHGGGTPSQQQCTQPPAPEAPPRGLICGCGPGMKLCSSGCVPIDDPDFGCAIDSCTPCARNHGVSACEGGRCAMSSCALGWADCDGSGFNGCEVNLEADPANCRSCGNVCPSGQKCSPAGCVPSCTPPLTDCGSACADLTTSEAHCGGCNNDCALAAECVGGTCVTDRPCVGTSFCAATYECVDRSSDPGNCGNCERRCPAPGVGTAPSCTGFQCGACAAGYTACTSGCKRLDRDVSACGSCTTPCTSGVCQNGTCTPLAPLRLLTGLTQAEDLTLGSQSVFVLDRGAGGVLAVPKTGGTPLTLATDQRSPRRIAANSTHVYWSNELGGAIMRSRIDRGAPEVFLATATPWAVGVDSGYLYFSQGGLSRVPLAGGTTEIVAASATAQDVAFDHTYVYWVSGTQHGLRIKKSGGPLERLPRAYAHIATSDGENFCVADVCGDVEGRAPLRDAFGTHGVLRNGRLFVLSSGDLFESHPCSAIFEQLTKDLRGQRLAVDDTHAYVLARANASTSTATELYKIPLP